jgi:hypothetical protein
MRPHDRDRRPLDKSKRYVGVYNDQSGGMTTAGTIIRDAWVFGLLPEEETCEGWTLGQIDALYDKVSRAWAPYGHLVSNLPEELRLRHARIYSAAAEYARAHGWNPELDDED